MNDVCANVIKMTLLSFIQAQFYTDGNTKYMSASFAFVNVCVMATDFQIRIAGHCIS